MTKNMRDLMGAAAVCWALGLGAAHAEDGVSATSSGLEFEAGAVQATLGGRLHLDAASVDNGGTTIDDEEVRRARLELAVRFGDNWRLRVDREFAHGGGWRNAWLAYAGEDFNIKAGNFIAPFSMEDVGSSNDTMFMERSLVQALAPGFGVGVGGSYEGRHFSIAGGYFGDAIDAEDNIQAEKGDGVALRATWSPIERSSNTFHLGLGLERREFGNSAVRRISTGPEASLAPTILSTGSIANPDTSMSYNVEAAYSVGPVLLQAQFVSTGLQRSVGADLTFDGYYAQAGWIVTGERHEYGDASGVFRGPRPRNDWGALELAARYSSLDLSEAGAPNSGKADDVTAGVNWYIGRNFRLAANYVHSKVDAINPVLDRDVDTVQARAQVDF